MSERGGHPSCWMYCPPLHNIELPNGKEGLTALFPENYNDVSRAV
jgi:hypothetical protein